MNRLGVIIFIVFFLFASTALAATPGRQQGKAAYEQGQYKQALGYLLTAFSHAPDDPEINFYVGRCYFELGRYEEAVMSFERVLFVVPDNSRTKLELARAYLSLGSKEFAKQYFQEVLATNPPEAVWQNIQRFLQTIRDSEQSHFFTGTLSVGYDHDDNPRVAPISDTVSLGILEFTLSGEGAVPEEDGASIVTVTANHIYRGPDSAFSWKTSLLSYNSFWMDEHDLDINYVEVATGPSLQNDYFLWQNNVLATLVDVEHENYFDSWGISSALTSQLIERFIFTGKLRFEDKDNKPHSYRSAENFQAMAQAVFLMAAARVSFSMGKERESASSELLSYERTRFQLRLDTSLPYGIAFFAGFAARMTDYREEDLFFQVRRSDDLHELSAGLSKQLWQNQDKHQNLTLSATHKYTDSESNIGLYTYRRNISNISLTYAF